MQNNINLFSNDISKEFWVFLDPKDSFIQHQVGLIGSFSSIPITIPIKDYKKRLRFLPNEEFTGFISQFQNNLIRNYTAEYNLEIDREKYFGNYPSRLESIFLFEFYEDAKKYLIKHPEHVENRILKKAKTEGKYCYSAHDSSWVNYLRLPHAMDITTINNITKSYWSGEKVEDFSNITSFGKNWTENPVIEVLLIGKINFYNKSLCISETE